MKMGSCLDFTPHLRMTSSATPPTAASFAKGFLDLQGDPTPILAGLVMRDSYAQRLLDEPIPKEERDKVKMTIKDFLSRDWDFADEEVLAQVCPTNHPGLRNAAKKIKKPKETMAKIYTLCQEYCDQLRRAKAQNEKKIKGATLEEEGMSDQEVMQAGETGQSVLPRKPEENKGKSPEEIAKKMGGKVRRWEELIKGLRVDKDKGKDKDKDKGDKGKDKEKDKGKDKDKDKGKDKEKDKGKDVGEPEYDYSKIPEAWDDVFYDLTQSRDYLDRKCTAKAEEIVKVLQPVNDWISWSEYGITRGERLHIGSDVSQNLVKKFLEDLDFMVKEEVEEIMDEESGEPHSHTAMPEEVEGEEGVEHEQHEEGTGSEPIAVRRADTKKLNEIITENGNKEWHPRLSKEVSKLTGRKEVHVKSRIYVTSSSTMHSLMNVFMQGHGKDEFPSTDKSLGEPIVDGCDASLNYLTHIVIRCYETPGARSMSSSQLMKETSSFTNLPDKAKRQCAEKEIKPKFKVEISMSPGACVLGQDNQAIVWPNGSDIRAERIKMAPRRLLCKDIPLDEFEDYIKTVLGKFSTLPVPAASRSMSMSGSPTRKDTGDD
eukprot:CAMPEP_0178457576 /NCGR_PEP_ID=MMETSP0689_2-20121128/47086_1 /TAXON_ID=160604 /ORGANISM="Amphidinium massartii, Strain CS-259" /LENGTH=598 /DNA_ID=CAMNT_0020083827 /DNA_START=40 /DNA_END=1834 /DNA_ORIENTATION=+